MLLGIFESKKEREERLARVKRECEENEAKYEQVCSDVEAALLKAHKPKPCNTVTSGWFGADFFGCLTDVQWGFQDWDVWRYNGKLYFYRAEVSCYPDYFKYGLSEGKPAPMLLSVRISDIQYFKMEGDIVQEVKISGGQVKQNRHNGRISQTPIQSKTIRKDERRVRITTNRKGVIRPIDFKPDAYDVLFALIPEKEYSRVVKA